MRPDKVLSLLGIAAKSGSVASGEFSTEKAVKERQAYLVILASDASDNTRKHFKDMCTFRSIPYYVYADKDSLGHCIGKQFRASVAVTNEGLARAIEKQLKTDHITTE